MQQYYGKTDESNVYAIATVLDPFLKNKYWEEEQWEEHYITEAMMKVQNEWVAFKAAQSAVASLGPAVSASSKHGKMENNLEERFFRKRRYIEDELQTYLAEPRYAGSSSTVLIKNKKQSLLQSGPVSSQQHQVPVASNAGKEENGVFND